MSADIPVGTIVAWKPDTKGYQVHGLRTGVVVEVCTIGEHFMKMLEKGFATIAFVSQYSPEVLAVRRAIVRVHPCRGCPSGREYAPDPQELEIVENWTAANN